jgi:hypothetical protein
MTTYSSFRRIDSVAIIDKQVSGVDIVDNVNLGGVLGVKVPSGTTEQRPTQGNLAGTLRYNTSTQKYEGSVGNSWHNLGGGATGGGTDEVFLETARNVTSNYILSADKNAASVGPITINNGISVTIPNNCRWVIL